MTILTVMSETSTEVELRTTDPDVIRAHLDALGVEFDRREVWPAPGSADQDEVLARHRVLVDQLSAERGFRLADVASLTPSEDDEWSAIAAKARATFRDEHSHGEDEVRLFVSGTGCFYLHLGGRVHAVVCNSGDLLSVPAGTPHWFDMGERPKFCAIRFFEEEDGWIGKFEPDSIAARYPTLEELVDGAAR